VYDNFIVRLLFEVLNRYFLQEELYMFVNHVCDLFVFIFKGILHFFGNGLILQLPQS